MSDFYRAPKLVKKDGYCFFQNGTLEKVSNNAVWAVVEPSLDMMTATSETFKMVELGAKAELLTFIDELSALTMQIGKLLVKIKKEGGSFLVLDPDYFLQARRKIENEIANAPCELAEQIKEKRAAEFAKQFRICARTCVLHNYEQTKALKIEEIYTDKLVLSQKDVSLIDRVVLSARQDNVKIDF